MIYYFLLAVSILLAVCKSSLYNAYAKRNELSWCSIFGFNAISYGVAFAIALIGVLSAVQLPSPITVLCAFLYAVIVVSLQSVSIYAMRAGTMAATSMLVMYGMIIPAVAGPIFWHEPIGALQIVGILMMLVSLALMQGNVSAHSITVNKKWIAPAILAFLLSGMAGVMEKIHQSTEAAAERLPFVALACAFMLAFSLGALLPARRTEKKPLSASMLSTAVLSGLVIGIYSTVNLTLSGKLDSMIYYPIANGGALILTVLVSVVLFHEQLDKQKAAGVLIGLAGILCLSIPI